MDSTIISRESVMSTIRHLQALVLFLPLSVFAQTPEPEAAADPNAALWKAASEAMIRGPQAVDLLDQARLQLPEGYGFVPHDPAEKLMESMGNQAGSNFIGLIFPLSDKNWFVTVEYEKAGYIKDDEARDWDADGLLKNLREGTEA